MSNNEAAGRAAKEFAVEVIIIKKTSPEYASENNPLPCPSVVLNGKVLARNDVITYEALKTALEAAAREALR